MLALICQGYVDLDLKAYLIGARLRLGALELSACASHEIHKNEFSMVGKDSEEDELLVRRHVHLR